MSFKIEDGVLTIYFEEDGETAVVIPEGVTSIGDRAFCWRRSLESVTIPDSVTSIGEEAFARCESLKSITIPDSVKNIGMCAFDATKFLKNYPDDWVIINGILIKYKGNSEDVVIPDYVTSIADGAFEIYYQAPEYITFKGIDVPFKRKDITKGVQDFFKVFVEKDFSVKIPAETKYDIACYLFNQNPADPKTYAYFKKNVLKVLKFAIDEFDTETVNNAIKEGTLITKKNIDKLIDYAGEKNRTKIKTILEDYKKQL